MFRIYCSLIIGRLILAAVRLNGQFFVALRDKKSTRNRIFVLRAHAAEARYFRNGLESDVRRKVNQRPLWVESE